METHEKSLQELIIAFTDIGDETTMTAFFQEIFTEKELDDFALRWRLLQELQDGKTQRSIAADHHISLCKITRGSKVLKNQNSVTRLLIKKYYGEKK